MKKALLVIHGSFQHCPRAINLSHKLNEQGYLVEVLSTGASQSSNAPVTLAQMDYRSSRSSQLRNGLWLLLGQWEKYLRANFSAPVLPKYRYELIVCHDVILLPWVLEHLTSAKLIVDFREFYPRQFESNWLWRLTLGRLLNYICANYCHDDIDYWTVSPGLKRAYENEYGVKAEVVPSHPLAPRRNSKKSNTADVVRLVHIGVSNKNRKLENMFDAIGLLPEHYRLDLFLLNTDSRYFKNLMVRSASDPNIRVLPPLDHGEIIEQLSKYDIGLFCAPNSTFNLNHAWPNKVFQYLWAGLSVVATPLSGMQELSKREKRVFLTEDCSPAAIAKKILELNTHSNE